MAVGSNGTVQYIVITSFFPDYLKLIYCMVSVLTMFVLLCLLGK